MSINKKKRKILGFFAVTCGTAFVGMSIFAGREKAFSIYENDKKHKNPFEGKKVIFIKDESDKENADGVKGHLEVIGDVKYTPGFYERRIKRAIDIVLSFVGLVALSPVFAIIILAIKIEDSGPVLFTQKRVGQNKRYFQLHKFRSMKMSTPHDVPTHQLENPEQYITKVGKILRNHSLDELPQIWDILIGNMSVIGPRPSLWNQDLLIAEREKYGVNEVKPGLTGWAQINGRDELEIPAKAKLDGEYVKKLGPLMDLQCFVGSLRVFLHDDSVVEGGIGEMKKKSGKACALAHIVAQDEGMDDAATENSISFTGTPKRILITGMSSYIGMSVENWLNKYPEHYQIHSLDVRVDDWRDTDFSVYDVVYHVAGIAHTDVGNVTERQKQLYYKVNTDLAVEIGEIAKKAGVKQFIFMSSMLIYSGCEEKIITTDTQPRPFNFYGDSKWQADQKIQKLEDDRFKVVVLRPPMIYGKGCKGNYQILAKMATKLPIFPKVKNKRSMLHIDNLCQFIKLLIDNEESGVFFPQNAEYAVTSEMVKMIADVNGHKILMLPLGWMVKIAMRTPGIMGRLAAKAFGNFSYEMSMSEYKVNYRVRSLKESIERTERDVFDKEVICNTKNRK